MFDLSWIDRLNKRAIERERARLEVTRAIRHDVRERRKKRHNGLAQLIFRIAKVKRVKS